LIPSIFKLFVNVKMLSMIIDEEFPVHFMEAFLKYFCAKG